MQHTSPCKECPFRRVAPAGYLGGNSPKEFAFHANRNEHFECHRTMKLPEPKACAGRAIMWANQCKKPRDPSVLTLSPNRETVFSHTKEFMDHHGISMTVEELMFGPDEE